MKRFLIFLLGTASCNVPSCEPDAPTKKPDPVATCKKAQGDVRSRAARAVAWDNLRVGANLYSGDWVQTTKAARAAIEFSSGGELIVDPSSLIVIQDPRAGKKEGSIGRIAIRRGGVRGAVKKGVTSDKVVLETPDGKSVVLASAGGAGPLAYRVFVRPDGSMEVAVTGGKAEIIDADGTQKTLEAGQAYDVIQGRVAGNIVELPDFPRLVTPGVDATVSYRKDLKVRMAWAAVPDIGTFRIEVSSDQSFFQYVDRATVKSTEWRFAPDRPATYYWRVISQNAEGREGEFGFARRLRVVEGPIGTLLVGPKDGSITTFAKKRPRIDFSWQTVEPPAPYRLVVSKQQDLTENVVLTIETQEQKWSTRDLEKGTYYWGVFAARAEGLEPLFTEPRKLTILRKKGIENADLTWE